MQDAIEEFFKIYEETFDMSYAAREAGLTMDFVDSLQESAEYSRRFAEIARAKYDMLLAHMVSTFADLPVSQKKLVLSELKSKAGLDAPKQKKGAEERADDIRKMREELDGS